MTRQRVFVQHGRGPRGPAIFHPAPRPVFIAPPAPSLWTVPNHRLFVPRAPLYRPATPAPLFFRPSPPLYQPIRPIRPAPLTSAIFVTLVAAVLLATALTPGAQIIPLAAAATIFTIATLFLSLCLISKLFAKSTSAPSSKASNDGGNNGTTAQQVTSNQATPYSQGEPPVAYATPINDDSELLEKERTGFSIV